MSEVRAADEVTLVDAVYRANGCTLTAAGAEVVIYGREVVDNLDSAIRTSFLTLHTADTAVLTVLTYVSALVVIGALNDNTLGVFDEVNDTVGTLTHTDAAADTLFGVDSCHIVANGDSALRTNLSAVAVAKTGIVAYTVAAVRHVGSKAGLVALIVVSLFNNVTRAVTSNVCNLFYYILSFYTENACDFLCSSVTARYTEVGGACRTVSQSLCITVTARVTASAAVCTGKAVTDSDRPLVLLHCEEHR